MNSPRAQLVTFFSSLRLTVVLLVMSIVLVFAATLDQVHLGVWGVQGKYFRSFVVFSHFPGSSLAVPVFPGGYLLGAALIANLVTAHFTRFRLSWKKSGIWLVHIGLILLLAGEGLSGLLQEDNQMRIEVGQTQRYSESFREIELVVIDTSHSDYDQVVSIPAARLTDKSPIQHPLLPFTVRPVGYFPNATLQMRPHTSDGAAGIVTSGAGSEVVAIPLGETTKPNESNWPAAYIELVGTDGSLGTFLVSTMLEKPEAVTFHNRTWLLSLRARRDYLPFSITLRSFTHDNYPGTTIPRDFASTILLRSDNGSTDREVRIFMNNPLRFDSRAFYQAGYANNDRTSVLQVVHNPSWQIPYVSCALMVAGLVIQFGIHLVAFFRRRLGAGNPDLAGSPL